MGLVNWVVPAGDLEARLAAIVAKALQSSRTATGTPSGSFTRRSTPIPGT